MTGATSASSTVEDVTAVGAASQSPPLHDAAKPASPAATAAAAVPEHATPATAHEGANRAASASSRVGDVVRTVGAVIVTTFQYWLCLVQHLVRMWRGRPSYAQSRFFQREEELQARVHVYSLALVFHLWNKPHYRSGTFGADMRKNLRNVAIPGTGIPLSVFCHFRVTALWFMLFVYPFVAFIAACARRYHGGDAVRAGYREQLLFPQDWFSYWRLNCRLASWHAHVTESPDFRMEDKWTFLKCGDEQQVPISPFDKVAGTIVVKDRNEEGGMGVHFYHNAAHGGDWIIQQKLENGPSLAAMLPRDAPLSTLRIITSSNWTVDSAAKAATAATTAAAAGTADSATAGAATGAATGAGAGAGSGTGAQQQQAQAQQQPSDGVESGAASDCMEALGSIQALSCVFRAGRAGAATDHQSILFDVDLASGVIKCGTTNAHWYCLGPRAVTRCPWTSDQSATHHPDCMAPVTGVHIPELQQAVKIVRETHAKLLPHVPLAGWDVAITSSDPKVCLLEVNLSCNFFRGAFDVPAYFRFVDGLVRHLEQREQAATNPPRNTTAAKEA